MSLYTVIRTSQLTLKKKKKKKMHCRDSIGPKVDKTTLSEKRMPYNEQCGLWVSGVYVPQPATKHRCALLTKRPLPKSCDQVHMQVCTEKVCHGGNVRNLSGSSSHLRRSQYGQPPDATEVCQQAKRKHFREVHAPHVTLCGLGHTQCLHVT